MHNQKIAKSRQVTGVIHGVGIYFFIFYLKVKCLIGIKVKWFTSKNLCTCSKWHRRCFIRWSFLLRFLQPFYITCVFSWFDVLLKLQCGLMLIRTFQNDYDYTHTQILINAAKRSWLAFWLLCQKDHGYLFGYYVVVCGLCLLIRWIHTCMCIKIQNAYMHILWHWPFSHQTGYFCVQEWNFLSFTSQTTILKWYDMCL